MSDFDAQRAKAPTLMIGQSAFPDTRVIDPQYIHIFVASWRYGVWSADPLTQPLDEARRTARRYYTIWDANTPDLPRVTDHVLSGPAGPFSLRLYYPNDRTDLPVMVYFHGGGFVLNGLDTHDRLMRQIVAETGIAIAAVDYSLAPEHRYPTQLHESVAAIRWVVNHAAVLGLDGDRIAVGGDSAGANLALSAALTLRDTGSSPIAMIVLNYGMFAPEFDTASHRRFGGGGYGLTTDRMRWYWKQYLGDHGDPSDPHAAPIHADLRGLPPVMLIGAGADCLLDDTTRLAERLTEADVPHRLSLYPGALHSFLMLGGYLDAADRAIEEIATGLREVMLAPYWRRIEQAASAPRVGYRVR
jgi:acetyl esterase